MPYRRGYGRRRRYGRRRPAVKQTTATSIANVAKTAYSAYKMGRYIYSLINVEFKYYTLSFSGQNPTTAPQFDLLTGIAQGDDVSNRSGRKILLKSVFIRGNLNINSSATQTNVRFMIIMDKNGNGATPGAAEVFNSTSSINLVLNPDNAGERFKVLWDKNFNLSINGRGNATVYKYIKLFNHCGFDGTSGAVGDCTSNHLWLVTISSEATNTPAWSAFTRVRFIDN